MWETLRNVWRVPELRKKVLYTFFMLLIYRLVSVIPAPGVDVQAVQSAMGQYDMLGLVNMMTGNAFGQMTIMAMGISPYINASIIMQLLTIAIPALERLSKDGGEEGKKKINRITRYVTVGLAALQAIGIIAGLQAIKPSYANFFGYMTIGIIMAGGTALAMWIGERITKNGIGNGISLLIFAGIISNLFNGTLAAAANVFNGGGMHAVGQLATIVIATLVILVIVTFVDMAERRIPVQYAKRVVGRKMYGGQSTHIPLKLNSSGVLPLIFANAIMQFPATILAFFPNSGANAWWTAHVSSTHLLYQIIFALMIFGFTFFYSEISFNPVEIAKNIQNNGGMIPGIRQGKPTSDYIKKISRRITMFGAIYLAVLAVIPMIIYSLAGVSLPFAASSLLIAVSVAMETMRELESQMLMRHYKGFLN